jgi:hypothetical protein
MDRLLPQQDIEDIVQVALGRSLLPPSFLGINATVQPQKPTPANRQKPKLSESDDADPSGFIFFQLGQLEYARLQDGEQGWPSANGGDEADDKVKLDWQDSNFCLVARVGPDGKAEGIYAVYDIFHDVDYEDERYLVPPSDFLWGMPPAAAFPGCKYEQFSCARVGNRLSDFGKRHHMVWTDKIRDPIELVRVLRSGEDRLEFGSQHQTVYTDKIKDPIMVSGRA